MPLSTIFQLYGGSIDFQSFYILKSEASHGWKLVAMSYFNNAQGMATTMSCSNQLFTTLLSI
jgi:hypothetical protein